MENSENFDLGIATGYHHFFNLGKNKIMGYTGKVKDFGFIPLAASAQYSIDPKFLLVLI